MSAAGDSGKMVGITPLRASKIEGRRLSTSFKGPFLEDLVDSSCFPWLVQEERCGYTSIAPPRQLPVQSKDVVEI